MLLLTYVNTLPFIVYYLNSRQQESAKSYSVYFTKNAFNTQSLDHVLAKFPSNFSESFTQSTRLSPNVGNLFVVAVVFSAIYDFMFVHMNLIVTAMLVG
jgi:hypothetical protein